MKSLFRISTNKFTFDFDRVSDKDPVSLLGVQPTEGRLNVTPICSSLEILSVSIKDEIQQIVVSRPQASFGPRLFEQTSYSIYLEAKDGFENLEIRHHYPTILKGVSKRQGGKIVHGNINFRGQIGRSTFSIYLDGIHQLDFEVEVFPTKIDYETDYQEIIGDIQSILTSLAYDYLRSTYQLGKYSSNQRASKLEWLVLLEHIIDELEKALNYVAQHPTRGLIRREKPTRLENIRRVDSRVRSQLRRGHGKGSLKQLNGTAARERINHRPTELTLDTMEHRWLRNQLVDVQRRLSQIAGVHLKEKEITERRIQILDGINKLKGRVNRLIRLEPIDSADGNPPIGFASLQLVSAPGYREAYRMLMFLKMSLRLEGDLVKLSVKDLEILYEYWTYLTVVRIIQDEHGEPTQFDQLFKIKQSGLSVQLKKGKKQSISFRLGDDRHVDVDYNPEFRNKEKNLIPQKPDILIRIKQENWPNIQLVCDAKYRIDATEEYKRQFDSYGPPTGALNVLHRYRDAILEDGESALGSSPFKRTVVQGAALFPMNEIPGEDFRNSRLWMAIEKIGVGAVPAIPSNTWLLKEWLLSALRQGGWSLADKAISSVASEYAHDSRLAASEPVLVGLLRSPGSTEHLDWVRKERIYYCPESKTQRRQYVVKQVAIYVPVGIGEPSGIQYFANVEDIEVRNRSDIKTPWDSRQNERMVVYHLGELQKLVHPITIDPDARSTMRQNRWTSRLGLQRARAINEIALETEIEWRLLEWLKANKFPYRIESKIGVKLNDPENPKGRSWIHLGDDGLVSVRYDGLNRFLVKSTSQKDKYLNLKSLIDNILGHDKMQQGLIDF